MLLTDLTVGVAYLNNRHYDSTTGVFISVDPLVTKTMQPYIYGAANPVTYSDPDGLEPCPKSGCSAADMGGRLPVARWAIDDQPERGDFSDCAHGSTASYCDKSPGSVYHQQLFVVSGGTYDKRVRHPDLPSWVPNAVQGDALADAQLAAALWELDEVARMPLDEFEERWLEASLGDGLNWTNDGCSDRNAVTGGAFGCIRHDFVYRNNQEIDREFRLGGQLRLNAHELKSLADRTLGHDIGGGRGFAVWFGVYSFGDGFHGVGTARPTAGSVYGDSPHVVLP